MSSRQEIYDSFKILLKNSWYNYKRKIFTAIVVMVVCGLLEGIGLLSLVPLLQLTNLDNFSTQHSSSLTPFSSFFQLKFSLESLLVFYIVLVSSIAVISYLNTRLINKLQAEFVSDYRCRLYHHYLYANYQRMVTAGRSTVNHLLTKEVERVGLAVYILTRLVAALITVAISIITACFLSLSLTLIALASGAVLYLLLAYQAKHAHRLGKKDSILYDKLFKVINDQLNCIKMIKVYGNEKNFFDRFHATDSELQQQKITYNLINTKNSLWYSIGGVIAFSVIFYIANTFFKTPLPVLFVLLVIFSRIVPKISCIQHDIHWLISSLPAVTIVESNIEKFSAASTAVPVKAETLTLNKLIECKDIKFRYSLTDPYIFQQLNLQIPANKITAIVGASGMGKSTLVDILMGLLTPEAGAVLVDGQALTASNLASWQRGLGYVPRDSHILQESIRSNLLLANPAATEAQMWAALESTRAAEFIKCLPHKLDTLLDDLGGNLSAGEKQRLMLASALLRQPKLLILDEATNSVDAANELLIYEALKNLREKLTIILITHNMYHLNWVDQVVNIEELKVNATTTTAEVCDE